MSAETVSSPSDHEKAEATHAAPERARLSAASMALRHRILESEEGRIRDTLRHLRTDANVVEAGRAIVRAQRRYVLGAGRSSAFAALCAWDLSAGLSQVNQVDAGAITSIDLLADVRSNDVLVVYSFKKYRSEPVAVAREFAAAGGLLVAITDSPSAPISSVADCVVVVPTAGAAFEGSASGVTIATHVITTLATSSSKGARRRSEERERLSRVLHAFEEGLKE